MTGGSPGWRYVGIRYDQPGVGPGRCALCAAVAIVGQGFPPVAAASGAVAILAGFGAGMLDTLQDWSPTDSVWMAIRSTSIGVVITTYPQV
jgi:hypothetical protein